MKISERIYYFKEYKILRPGRLIKELNKYSAKHIIYMYIECSMSPYNFGLGHAERFGITPQKIVQLLISLSKFMEMLDTYITKYRPAVWYHNHTREHLFEKAIDRFVDDNNIQTFNELVEVPEELLTLFKLQVLTH